MSLSDEWTEYHLTPRGWETGTMKMDFSAREDRPRPSDAVLTICHREQQSSSFSKVDKTTTEVWRSNDETQLTELLKMFGKAPRGL